MFLSPQLAQSIADDMKCSIHRDINIMDQSGTIIASTNPARLRQCHEGARQVIAQGLRVLEVRSDSQFPGAQQGVNLPIVIDGETVGVIGITGRAGGGIPLRRGHPAHDGDSGGERPPAGAGGTAGPGQKPVFRELAL